MCLCERVYVSVCLQQGWVFPGRPGKTGINRDLLGKTGKNRPKPKIFLLKTISSAKSICGVNVQAF